MRFRRVPLTLVVAASVSLVLFAIARLLGR
jgi:hypothetical protein